MKEIILITNAFPYYPGEQFLETEIKYFEKNQNLNLTIIPIYKSERQRAINPSINIDPYIINNKNLEGPNKYISLVQNIFSKYFYNEFYNNEAFTINKLKIFNGSMNNYRTYYKLLDAYFTDKKDLKNTIVYTYWHTETTYALQTLKEKYNFTLISRIHGYDLYKERRIFNYFPLKKQFVNGINKIYTITEHANTYLESAYGFTSDTLELSRLGVEDHNIISLPNKDNIFHIVSCSFLTQVKRIDKVITALEMLSKENPQTEYTWTHIGDGELYEELYNMASKKLEGLKNIHFSFTGNMDNKDVYLFYKNNPVDVFLNVSESEGVPVSIMEAMSCHIPIIAPDVGGISDMVLDNYNGSLLSDECKVEEIVSAFNKRMLFKAKDTRAHAYEIFKEKYDASINYKLFIEKIINV